MYPSFLCETLINISLEKQLMLKIELLYTLHYMVMSVSIPWVCSGQNCLSLSVKWKLGYNYSDLE